MPVTQRLVAVWALGSGFANVTQPLSSAYKELCQKMFSQADVDQTVLLLVCYLHLKNFSCCFHRWRSRAPFGIHPHSPHQSAAGPGTSCGPAELSGALLPGYTELLLPLWGAVFSSPFGLNPRERSALEHGHLPEKQRNPKSDNGPEMG